MSCRQNYTSCTEALINAQINEELFASYQYQAMAAYFDREDVALPGLRDHFAEESEEEREHAELLIKYQNKRGGRVTFQAIRAPTVEWNSALEALEYALALEKGVNQKLLDLQKHADSKGDAQCCDFIESNFLEGQVEGAKKLADYITQLKRCGEGLGVYLFDKNM